MENNTTPFAIIPALLKELETESASTRKMLRLVPHAQHSYKPHERSMVMRDLAVHIAELPSWIAMALHTDGLDFAAMPYKPTEFSSNEDLLAIFERSLAEGRTALEGASEGTFNDAWVLRHGDQILADMTRYETIRISFAQTTHHRAQLGVYLRLLNIPIPGTYGPSADENGF